MLRLRVGKDEIRFVEENHGAAETIARLLPEIRRKGEEIAGVSAPKVRVVMSGECPRAWDYLRPLPLLYLAVLVVAGVAALVVATDPDPLLMFGLSAVSVPALMVMLGLWVFPKRVREQWPHQGGSMLEWRRVLSPVIIVHWPLPTKPEDAVPLWVSTLSADQVLEAIVVHEFAHLLINLHYRSDRLPPWLSEGYAFWFAEQMIGFDMWLPETRSYAEEPEPKHDSRLLLGQNAYRRLCARYYWEVRALADAGRLPELLKAPLKRVGEFRPQLQVAEESAKGL